MNMRRCAQVEPIEGQAIYQQIFRVMDIPVTQKKPDGWVWVEKGAEPLTHYWNNLRRVAIPLPPRPGFCWRFDYAALKWVVDESLAWADVRRQRDELLGACDWRILPDAPTSKTDFTAWLAYRQALRDITGQGDPLGIVWPEPP